MDEPDTDAARVMAFDAGYRQGYDDGLLHAAWVLSRTVEDFRRGSGREEAE